MCSASFSTSHHEQRPFPANISGIPPDEEHAHKAHDNGDYDTDDDLSSVEELMEDEAKMVLLTKDTRGETNPYHLE